MEDLDHSDWKLALQELFQGREAAAKLRGSLSDEDESPVNVLEDLAQIVAGSFTKALSLLGHCEGTASDGTAASSCLSSSTDSTLPRSTKIDGRGRYKRWKFCSSWTATTPALVDDGHAWRKYGQKTIHGSDFPRSYFRCTHKNDQSCSATKQVQQISRDPPLYQTIYYGQHTCKRTSVPQQVISDDSNLKDGKMFNLISFDQNVPWKTEDQPLFSSIFFSNSCKDEPLG